MSYQKKQNRIWNICNESVFFEMKYHFHWIKINGLWCKGSTGDFGFPDFGSNPDSLVVLLYVKNKERMWL